MVTIGMYYEVLEGKEQVFRKPLLACLVRYRQLKSIERLVCYAVCLPNAATSSCRNGPVKTRLTNLYVRMSLLA